MATDKSEQKINAFTFAGEEAEQKTPHISRTKGGVYLQEKDELGPLQKCLGLGSR